MKKTFWLVFLAAIAVVSSCNRQASVADLQSSASPTVSPAAGESSPSPAASVTPTPPLTPVEFTDVTQEAGIRFRHNNGAYGKKYLPETTGSGCAFLDYDNDGWQDILLVNSMDFEDAPKKRRSVMALYHNDQNGKFSDVTSAAGLAKPMYGMGVAAADYDNDGWVDIYVTALGQSRLFRNGGNGKFTDVTAKAGLTGAPAFSTSAAWLDFDKDGFLDLFVCNYVDWSIEKDLHCTLDGTNKSYCTPESYKGQSSRLYRNTGGKFEDISERAGIQDPTSKSLGIVVLDYDRDGWPDIFVANDTEPNKLYHNNGKGSFTETAVAAGIAFSEEGKARAGMGVDTADYDRSGYPSLAIGNFSNEMLGLYHNEGKAGGLFIDEAPSSTVGQSTLLSLTFGLFFFDYDLDGWPDLFLSNGHVADDINKVQPKITYAQSPKLFRNAGKKQFTEVSRKAGKPFQRPIVGRGTAYGDYDNDGDSDILISTNGGPAYLLRNEGGNQNRFVRFRTEGTKANRNGIGAKITLFLPDGVRLWNTVRSGSSYCSQNEMLVTFGLGQLGKIPRVEVEWPTGKTDTLTDIESNKAYLVKEGLGIMDSKPLPLPLAAPSPSPSPLASATPSRK
jgi:enediyne biosynthesis protein E4